MATYPKPNHTSHIMLSIHHHNIKNKSTQHHKHMYIIISTSTRHHIILKGSRDSTSHIKEFIIQDKHHFFPKKLHYLSNQHHLRNSPYKSIHLKKILKKNIIIFLWNLSWIFEILDFLLKCHSLSWILNFSFEL